jgi:hypothetical protein
MMARFSTSEDLDFGSTISFHAFSLTAASGIEVSHWILVYFARSDLSSAMTFSSSANFSSVVMWELLNRTLQIANMLFLASS